MSFRGIVGAAIVVLAWMFCILLELPYSIAALVTLLVAAVLGSSYLLGLLRERRAARELERAIAAQAERPVRPDLAHEIAGMRAEFERALAALKASRGKKNALYTLPWYAIIGPPGAGKSTALRSSGLHFPYVSASGGAVRGLGGTRNCDWWMTSEGVILDTAGRWTSEDDDRAEWLAFLDLARRFRPQKPLNGIIAAVSVAELGSASEEDVAGLARRIRERIDEVQGRLHLSLPVYVLFTKCDLMPGFVETFGAMSREERAQVWGQTAPLARAIGPAGDYFARGFDELVRALEMRSLKRMSEERKIADREMVYAFPQQLEVLRQNMSDFVDRLFVESIYGEMPRFRGVYFTSGTQEGRPIDRVMSRMAAAFGQREVPLPEPQLESKSYFLHDVFARIVFPDAGVAVRSPDELARQRRRVWTTSAAIFAAAIGMSALPAISFVRNRELLESTRVIAERVERESRGRSEGPIDPAVIEPLRARARLLQGYDRSAPILSSMGMYQGEVYAPVRDLYLAIVRRRAIEPLARADARELDAFSARTLAAGAPPPAGEARAAYERLKLHLVLSGEVPLDGELHGFARAELAERWNEARRVSRADRAHARIEDNVAFFVESIDEEELWIDRDEASVAQARAAFPAQTRDLAVDAIVQAVGGHDHRLEDLIGSGVPSMTATHTVPHAFTRRAWEGPVQRVIYEDAARVLSEHWVLGRPPPPDPAAELAALRSAYLERYEREWRALIDSIAYTTPHTLEEHRAMLAQLTSGDVGRYQALIRGVDEQVSIRDPSESPRERAIRQRAERMARQRLERAARTRTRGLVVALPDLPQRAPDRRPEQVREAFRGLLELAPPEPEPPAHQYEEQLRFVHDAIDDRLDGSETTRYEDMRDRAREVTERIVAARPEAWRDRIRALLTPPLDDHVPL